MDRRPSLASASDSEAEGETFSECLSSLPLGDGASEGRGTLLVTPEGQLVFPLPLGSASAPVLAPRPSTPHGRELLRRPCARRPAPLPPTRPPPSTTPLPTPAPPPYNSPLPSAFVTTTPLPATPVTTTPLATTPVSSTPLPPPPVTTTPLPSAAVTTTPLPIDPVTTTPLSAASVNTSLHITPVNDAPLLTTLVNTTHLPTTPISTTSLPTAPVNTTPLPAGPVSTTPLPRAAVSITSLPAGTISTTPLLTASGSTTPLPAGPISTTTLLTGPIGNTALPGGPVTTVHLQLASTPPPQERTSFITRVISEPVDAPASLTKRTTTFAEHPLGPIRPLSTPWGKGMPPPAPQRSSSSQAATRGLSGITLRLIDEESDSDAGQSDSYEEHVVFPRPQQSPAAPLYGQFMMGPPGTPLAHHGPLALTCSGQVLAASSEVASAPPMLALPPHLVLAPPVVSTPHTPQGLGPPHSPTGPGLELHNQVAAAEEDLEDEGPCPPPREGLAGRRGRARRLAHSSSDPGVARPPQWQHVQHPRSPGLAAPPPPPLDHLSEEEAEDTQPPQGREGMGGGLERSDSSVTVAHLYEDLLVSSRLRLRVTLTNLTVVVVVAALVMPNASTLLYTAFRLVFGTLFPAYYSYKAVKTKNVKEYVKWMMYWIVFAFFTCLETLTDIFLSFWFPFYYELKILVVLWLLSPATRGSSILYRKFVHPWLTRREGDIDNCIAQAKQQGYSAVINLGSKGVNYATTVIMQTAIKGGGGLMNQLRRSYSSGELADGDMNRNVKALPHIPDDDYEDPRLSSGPYDAEPRIRAESDAAYKPRGSSASRVVRSSKTRSADVTDYYQDVQEDAIQRRRSPRSQDPASRVLSADDLTSGYSSGDADAGDLTYDPLDGDPPPGDEFSLMPGPRRSGKVRRTQSLSTSTLSLHRSQRNGGARRGEVRAGLRAGGAGRGSGPADDPGAPASYSSSGHPAAPQQGSSFRRSRPGEVSAYATLPRTTKRAAAKKRQV